MSKKLKKRTLYAAGAILLSAILFAPNIACRFLKSSYANQLSEETGLGIEFGSLSAGWLSPVVLQNVSASTPTGEQVAMCKQISTEKNLLGLLFRGEELGEVHIDSLQLRIPLEGSTKDDLLSAMEQVDLEKGLLKELLNPDQDTIANLRITNATVDLQAAQNEPWHHVVQGLNARATVTHMSDFDCVSLEIEETPIELGADLCDLGLKFIAPVIEGAVDLQGAGAIEISQCYFDPTNFEAMSLDGSIKINGAYADIQASLLRKLANSILHGEQGRDSSAPVALQFADNCDIRFSVKNGMIHHEGVRFALTDVLPNTTLTSQGDVGFDQSLDFTVALAVPFEHMGESELLTKIGSPSISIPVSGSFEDPIVEIGKGQAIGGFVKEAVSSVTDGQVDLSAILQNISELGILRGKWFSKTDAAGADVDQTEPDVMTDEATDLSDTSGDTSDNGEAEETPKPRRRLLDRLRKRKRD